MKEENRTDFDRARSALNEGSTVEALSHLEKALKQNDTPSLYSYLGYCIARERGQVKKGIELCRQALDHDPDDPDHYLNLARIHLYSGNKPEAIDALRQGMTKGGNEEITKLLDRIGSRRSPVFSFLPRGHFLNRFVGILLSRLGIR